MPSKSIGVTEPAVPKVESSCPGAANAPDALTTSNMLNRLRSKAAAPNDGQFFNVIAGHSLDYVKTDSVLSNNPFTPVDSGNGFARHQWVVNGKGSPVSTVLLGVGADMLSAKGNLFNISLVWGISTRQVFAGSVREWNTLHQDYKPSETVKDPEEFPDHYYEWALRGSNLSLRASYMFKLKSKKEKDEAKAAGTDAKPEKANKEDGKVEKPAKEKVEKPAKEPKVPKEKKSKEN